MIKTFLDFIVNLLIITLFWWLIGSLVAWNFDPAQWIGFGRFIIIFFIIMSLYTKYKN